MMSYITTIYKHIEKEVFADTQPPKEYNPIAERLDIPEYILENIESGESYITYKSAESVTPALPISQITQEASDNKATERKWWEDLCDEYVERKIQDFC